MESCPFIIFFFLYALGKSLENVVWPGKTNNLKLRSLATNPDIVYKAYFLLVKGPCNDSRQMALDIRAQTQPKNFNQTPW